MNKETKNLLFSQKIIEEPALSFDDVLLVPTYSEVTVKQTNPTTFITQKLKLANPIFSACMDTISSKEMCITMALSGGVGVIHKNMSGEEQIEMLKAVKDYKVENLRDITPTLDSKGRIMVGVAVATEAAPYSQVQALVEAEVDFIVVDSAHAHSKSVIEFVKGIKATFPSLLTIVGNIVTSQAAEELIKAGADCLKVGIGSGSICTTRIVSGVGVPQITAIANVVNVAKQHNIPTIADGALKNSGDIVKALALGADAVMVGSLLSGTDQAPGEVIEKDGILYKEYVGMASDTAMSRGPFQLKKAAKYVAEGIKSLVPCKGDAALILENLLGGLKAGMGYIGAENLQQLFEKSKFIKITGSGYQESLPHILLRKHKYQF